MKIKLSKFDLIWQNVLKPLLPSSLCMSQTSGMKLTWNLVKFLSKMAFWTHSLIPSNSTNSKALQAKWKVLNYVQILWIWKDWIWKVHRYDCITNNAFWLITQTYFNSVDLIVFCIVKVFMVLLEMKTT